MPVLLLALLCGGSAFAATERPQPAASAAGAPALFIREYVVRGNTVLKAAEIENAVYPYVGPERSADDIEKARLALEELYQAAGYQTVQVIVPEPSPRNGAIYLQVVEATVGRLRVVGSKYSSLKEIKNEAPSLKEGGVPNFNDVHRDLVTLNQTSNRTVTPSLKAGKKLGTVDVDLQVKDQLPVSATLAINNDHNVNTTPLRINGSLSYDNLWQAGHSISVGYQVAPTRPGDAELYTGSYLAPFIGPPYSLQLTALKSNSNVSTTGSVAVIGKGVDIGLRGIMTLPGSDRFSHSVQAGVDYKDFDENLSFGTADGGIQTPVSYFPFTVAYNAYLHESTATDFFTVSLNFASPRLGSGSAAIDAKRFDARGGEFFLRAEYDRTQDLPGKFQAALRVQAQLADQPLIANEQFSLGGNDSVRGYFVAESLMDTGATGTLELRTPSLPQLLFAESDPIASIFNEFRFLVFVDGGRGELHQAQAEQQSAISMMSAGVGASVKLLDHFNGSLTLAVPMISTGATRSGSRLILFNLGTEY